MSYLYAVRAGDLVKIGQTISPKTRMAAHRLEFGVEIEKHALWACDCADRTRIEDLAVSLLSDYPTVRRESFIVDISVAIEAVETAAKHLGSTIVRSQDWDRDSAERVQLRMPLDLIGEIENWRAAHDQIMPLNQAVIELVRVGLQYAKCDDVQYLERFLTLSEAHRE